MIVIDSSAVVAILQGEPEAEAFVEAMRDNACHMAAPNVFEVEVVILQNHGRPWVARVRELLASGRVVVHPFDDRQAQLASLAYERFGKGRHPARLNLMDCAAYALAQSLDAPLLYKGDDFARTDIAPALTPG